MKRTLVILGLAALAAACILKETTHTLYLEPQLLGVADWRWVTLAEMDTFAFPRTDLQIIEVLENKKPPNLPAPTRLKPGVDM